MKAFKKMKYPQLDAAKMKSVNSFELITAYYNSFEEKYEYVYIPNAVYWKSLISKFLIFESSSRFVSGDDIAKKL